MATATKDIRNVDSDTASKGLERARAEADAVAELASVTVPDAGCADELFKLYDIGRRRSESARRSFPSA